MIMNYDYDFYYYYILLLLLCNVQLQITYMTYDKLEPIKVRPHLELNLNNR